MTHYKKTEYGLLMNSMMISGAAIPLFLFGLNIIPMDPSLIISSVFLITLLLFYKVTITITDNKIKAVFGIGIIKRSLQIDSILWESIEEIKVPAIYGIGIRFTPHGVLYNVKVGNAIKMKSDKKTFFVGTDDYSTIRSVLNTLKK